MSRISLAKWILGGAGTYLGYKFFFEDNTFEHVRLPMKREKNYADGNYGVTITDIFFDFEVYQDEKSRLYKVRLKKFRFTSQVELNARNDVFRNISEFAEYYKPEKNYVHSDYRSAFNTVKGTEYHEKLHQEEIDEIIKMYKPLILLEVERIEERDRESAEKSASECLNNFKRFFEGKNKAGSNVQDTKESKAKHKEIELKEWLYLHDQYKIWLDKQ